MEVCLICEDTENRVTVDRSKSWVDNLVDNAQIESLPEDEGLNESKCYKIYVKVIG